MDDDEILNQAQDLRKMRAFHEATILLKQLRARHPDSAAVLAVLAATAWDSGDLDSAIGYFEQAVALSPNSEIASLGVFHCLWNAGKKTQAIAEAHRFMSVSFSKDYEAILQDIRDAGGAMS